MVDTVTLIFYIIMLVIFSLAIIFIMRWFFGRQDSVLEVEADIQAICNKYRM